MASFHEVLFPTDISYGSGGGPKFKTFVFAADSGYEKRLIDWAHTKAEYDISYGIKDQHQMDRVTAFFYNRRGRAYGFRFKDWNDYKLAGATFLGTGLTDVQITKTYTSGQTQSSENWEYVRVITKPVWGSIAGLTVDGVLKTSPADYTVNYNTGIITFTTAPVTDAVIVIGYGEFHVPVRFDTDHLSVKHEFWNTVSWDSIPLMEDRTDWNALFGVPLGPPPPPIISPTVTWTADFKNGFYTLNGTPSDFSTLFTASDYGALFPGSVVVGVGLTGPTPENGAVGLGPSIFVPAGATYVFEFYMKYKWATLAFGLSRSVSLTADTFSIHGVETVSDATGYFRDNGELTTVEGGVPVTVPLPGLGAGNHILAINIQPTGLAVSVDGGGVQFVTMAAPSGIALSMGFQINSYASNEPEPTAYVTQATGYGLGSIGNLPTLSANTVVPPASPPTPPVTPVELWTADFVGVVGGHYTVAGATVGISDIFTEYLLWSTFNPSTDVYPAGLGGRPTLTQAVVSAMWQYGGATLVFTTATTGTSNFLLELGFSGNDLNEGIYFDLMRNVPCNLQCNSDNTNLVNIPTPILTASTSSVKVAITLKYNHLAASVNGGAVTTFPLGLLAGEISQFLFNISSQARISTISAFTPHNDADLPGLST